MNRTGAKLRIIILLITAFALIFSTACLSISFTYDISPYNVGKKLIRHGTLSIIHALTLIHDSYSTKNASLGPGNARQTANYDNYVRIKDFFEKAKFRHNFHVMRINNEKIIRSRFDFAYQPYDEIKLKKLRKEYGLDNVVLSAKDEFDAMVRLRTWTRSQFRRNDYQPFMKNFDALEVLKNNIRNKNDEPYGINQYRPCYFFPLFYSQVLLSMGHQARLVRISNLSEKGYNGHGMTEVWSNQFKKWITMDPDLNLYYEQDGIPLNMLEVHNERYNKGPSSVRIIRGMQNSGDLEYKKAIDIKDMIPYHSYIQILDMRNDWMTNHYFRGHSKRSDKATLFWIDKNLPSVFTFKEKTDDVNEFYWTLNQTEILCKKNKISRSILKLAFKTFTPNFKHYEIIIDDSKKIISKSAFYNWELHPGNNKLYIRSINKFGKSGIPSFVEILFDSKA